jgi:superfamily II DNA/RNA helicase
VPYKLSTAEAQLYKSVTDYVREEFNRAEALANDKRAGTVGFALTILQRRLASSPEAIYQSLRRRRERLESRLRELELLQRGAGTTGFLEAEGPQLNDEDVEDLEEAPDEEVQAAQDEVLDQATSARTISELKAEIEILKRLEDLAHSVKRSGSDTKWTQLAGLLGEIFANKFKSADPSSPNDSAPKIEKLIIFTEHRDTLNYLEQKISAWLGLKDALVVIHGGMGREERLKAQESVQHDPQVQVLIATDAAGEGINLQRAHLMVNYDLPWNPNRIEQRFGRIHRIGQTEVCHLWNLVAEETREGDVYRTLLEKLEEARTALGGQVFDVLGRLQFDGRPLRDLLIESIRYGERPEVRARLDQVVEKAFDREHLQNLLEERALAHDAMDASRVHRIREDMERADARRLQPHYVESFFLDAFLRLGGTIKQREGRRYEVTHVPALVRSRDRIIGVGEAILPRYERIAFEKNLVAPSGQALAAFVCPGHPLLDSTIDLTLERHRDLLRRGTVLVDDKDLGTQPRVVFYLEHSVQDGNVTKGGTRHVVSKRMLYVELDASGNTRHIQYAPYLDYRPLKQGEPGIDAILDSDGCKWITKDLEQKALAHAIGSVVPEHLKEVRDRKLELISKTEAAVKDRLTKEINYWDHRAEELKAQEQAGRVNARLNSGEARKRADALEARLQKRMEDLKLERQISALPPVVLGGFLVVPVGLVAAMSGKPEPSSNDSVDNQAVAARARAIIMEIERGLGFDPTDREFDKLGYDIESRIPKEGRLRFIEVKGRVSGADTITVTKNEILYSLNKPDDFILAIVEFKLDGTHHVHYIRKPFQREPDFSVTSVNYDMADLIARAEAPR